MTTISTTNSVIATLPPTGRQCLLLYVDATDAEALAFAQYLKRAGWSQYRPLAIDDQEAYDMQCAAENLRGALAACGFAPR
jgi:hypothetical protein